MVDLDDLADDAHRTRRILLLGTAGAAALSATVLFTWLGVGVGLGLVLPGLAARLPGQVVGLSVAGVGAGVALPWIGAMLLASAWYHRRLARVVAQAGLGVPAHGFRAARPILLAPSIVGAALFLVGGAAALWWPEPEGDDLIALVLAATVLVTPLLGPVVGLLWARERATDRRLRAAVRTLGPDGAVSAGHLAVDRGPFPLIDGRSSAVVRAEGLRRLGRLDEAETALRHHLRVAGLSPTSTLLTLARVLRDQGRLDEAEQAAAAAVAIFLPALSAWGLLAEIQEARGDRVRAANARAHAASIRAGLFGLVPPLPEGTSYSSG